MGAVRQYAICLVCRGSSNKTASGIRGKQVIPVEQQVTTRNGVVAGDDQLVVHIASITTLFP